MFEFAAPIGTSDRGDGVGRSETAATSLRPARFATPRRRCWRVSGSINCIKHLQATAVEAGVDVDVFRLFNDLGDTGSGLERSRPERQPTRSKPSRRRAARAR